MPRRLSFVLVTLGILLAACSATPPPPRFSAEEQEEFRQEMLVNAEKIDTFLGKTRRGTNLTEITLGWFVMILLNELSSHDQGLYDHLHADDANVEAYLRTNVQADAEGEIDKLGDLARAAETPEAGHIRLAAREAILCLTAIPDPKQVAEQQRDTRTELTATLMRLQRYLRRLGTPMGPSP